MGRWAEWDGLAEALGPHALGEVVDLFLTDTAARMGGLGASCAAADFARVLADAHYIKGAAKNFGEGPFVACCQRVEAAARAGDRAQVDAALASLQAAWGALESRLRAARAGL
jgi:HPt (histidine-containing phosphotransfer) domain-containing protein